MGIIEAIKKIEREEGIEEGLERGREEGIEIGIEKGIEKKNYEFVQNLLTSTDFSIGKIAVLVNVPEAFVKKVRTALKQKK